MSISAKNTLITESIAIGLLTSAITVIAIEAINKNKEQKLTQEEKLTGLVINVAISITAYYLAKKYLK